MKGQIILQTALWVMFAAIVIVGWWVPALGWLALVCMAAPPLVAVARGRLWCGGFCPRGALLGAIERYSRGRTAPAWLRGTPFRVGVLAFLMGMMGVQMVLAWPDVAAMGRVFVVLVSITTVVGAALALVYAPRTWCTFCPMGTLASWASRAHRGPVAADTCRGCAACAKQCPMGLAPHQPDAIHADCIRCATCVNSCPVNALTLARPGREPKVPEATVGKE